MLGELTTTKFPKSLGESNTSRHGPHIFHRILANFLLNSFLQVTNSYMSIPIWGKRWNLRFYDNNKGRCSGFLLQLRWLGEGTTMESWLSNSTSGHKTCPPSPSQFREQDRLWHDFLSAPHDLRQPRKEAEQREEKSPFFSRTSFFCGKWVDLALKFTPRFGKEEEAMAAAAAVWVVYERRLHVVFGVWKGGGKTFTFAVSLIVAHKFIFFEMHLNLVQVLLVTLVRKRKDGAGEEKVFPFLPPPPPGNLWCGILFPSFSFFRFPVVSDFLYTFSRNMCGEWEKRKWHKGNSNNNNRLFDSLLFFERQGGKRSLYWVRHEFFDIAKNQKCAKTAHFSKCANIYKYFQPAFVLLRAWIGSSASSNSVKKAVII